MTATTDSDLALLYQALAAPIGIVVHCTNPNSAKQRLFKARKQDPALAMLQIRTPVGPEADSQVWIIRETVDLGAAYLQSQAHG